MLTMAYRGYSYSAKTVVNEKGLKKDADAIVDFIKNPAVVDENVASQINKRLLFAHGRSLGGAVAVHMASENPDLFRGLIVENSFTSISDMVDVLFPILTRIKWLVLRIGWNSDQLVPKLRLPMLYVSGDEDELVPSSMTTKLYESSTRAVFKDLLMIKGGTHNDSWWVGRK